MRRYMVMTIIIGAVIVAVGCTRMSDEGDEMSDEDVESTQTEKKKIDAVITPLMRIPDVNISPSAEIPSDKDAVDFKVPDVKVEDTGSMDSFGDTRVDGVGGIVTEP